MKDKVFSYDAWEKSEANKKAREVWNAREASAIKEAKEKTDKAWEAWLAARAAWMSGLLVVLEEDME